MHNKLEKTLRDETVARSKMVDPLHELIYKNGAIKTLSAYFPVDINRWADISKISKREALLLTLWIDPYSEKALSTYPLQIRDIISAPPYKYEHIDLLEEQILNKPSVLEIKKRIDDNFKDDEIKFPDYIQWLSQLKSNRSDLPIYFKIEEFKTRIKTQTVEKSESPKTINFLYEIIGALISNYCCINPSVAAERLPKNITGHIKRVLSDFGTTRDTEAIRIHIIKALEQLTEKSPDLKGITHFNKRVYRDRDEDTINKSTPFF